MMIEENKKLELLMAVVHQSSNAIIITDNQKHILYVNKKFEDISGYALSDVIGRNPRVLKSGKTPEITYKQMNQTLAQGKIWKGEFTNIHRDGREYIEDAVMSVIKDDKGKIEYYLAEKTDITALKLAQNEVHSLAYYDTLTGLPNRAYFIQELEKQKCLVGSHSEFCFAVLFADLNRFKDINDIHGHLLGDIALREVARRFKEVTCAGDLLARIGGDEFVLLHKITSETSVARVAQRLSDSLQDPILIKGHEHYIGVSIGSSTCPEDGHSTEQLLQHADIAMYHAKASKSIYSAYKHEVGVKSRREFEISHKLERAVAKSELYLLYQPKVDVKTGHLVGAEALLRWNEYHFGEISPAEFIPIAERCGKMCIIGLWVIQQACRQLKVWERSGFMLPGRLAINISIQQVEHPEFYEQLIATVKGEGVSPYQIELEVTESVFINHPEKTSKILASLAKRGFTIAIDDFGTGYSSLAYLKKIQASILKIDRSFIKNVTINADDKTIVKSVVEMAHNLGLRVVAEGIEQQSQASYLSSINCDMAQGFLYSYPLSANKFASMLNAKFNNQSTLHSDYDPLDTTKIDENENARR
jgi:diguanylate cyclase (GGDEF)-like protein/PAS domain S-box-containing protein